MRSASLTLASGDYRSLSLRPQARKGVETSLPELCLHDAASGGHAYSRHGAHTRMLDQQRRATNGVPPDKPTQKPKKCGPNSTRFLSNVDQLDAIQRGVEEMNKNGTNTATIDMGRTIERPQRNHYCLS